MEKVLYEDIPTVTGMKSFNVPARRSEFQSREIF
jgi:hypothetical protein